MITYLIVLVLYFLILLTISFYANNRNKTQSDYILGGRNLGWLTTSIGAGSADMSAWIFLGLPGAAYLLGLNQIWIAIGLIVGAYFNWHLVSYNLRKFSAESKSLTISSFFANHVYGKGKVYLKIITTVVTIIFFIIYVASGFAGGAILLTVLFNFTYFWSIVITLIFVVSYVFIGGYLAVAWTDLLQGLLMIFIIICVPIFTLSALDWNFLEIKNRILLNNPNALNIVYNMSAINIISLLAWGLGYVGQPHILTKFMGIKDTSKLKRAKYTNILWMAVGMGFAILIGLLASAYFYKTPLEDPEKAILLLGQSTSISLVVAFISVAILAAIISTANSQLLIVASSIVEDIAFIKKFNKNNTMLLPRLILLVVAIISAIIALNKDSSILSMVGYAWAGFGASFGPLIILITRGVKLSSTAAICGVIVGAITVVVWKNLHGGIFDIYEILPAFILSFITILLVNIVKKPVVDLEN